MKKLIVINFLMLSIYSCTNSTDKTSTTDTNNIVSIMDTLIGKTNMVISEYRESSTGYFTIVNGVSSDFVPIFSEYKNKGIGLDLNLRKSKPSKSYFQKRDELGLILPKAALKYNMDSLKIITLGRLIFSGDLAITVTKEYKTKFGNNETISTSEYNAISDFLVLESTLSKDLNALLKPYSKVVSNIRIEKAYFTNKEILFRHNTISTKSSDIPEKILDFTTSIRIKNI